MRRGCRVAKRIQKPEKPRLIEDELNRIFSTEWLRETAKETGFVKRDRKIDPALMFWSLTLGFGVQLQRTNLECTPSSGQVVKQHYLTLTPPQILWLGILTVIVSRRVYCLVFSANLENTPRYTH